MLKEMLLLLLLLAGIRGAWAQTDPTDTSPTQTVCIGREPYLVTDHPNSIYSWSIFPANSGWQINGTSNSITVNWNIPGTYILTVVERNAQGCDGLPVSVTVTVNPIPNIVDPGDQVVWSGNPTTLVAFIGTIPGTVFNWVNNTPSIGLAASGTGSIAAFNASNAGTAPYIATIIVTPSVNGCVGTPLTFTITVNPSTSVDPVTNVAYCNGATTTAIAFNSPVTGTTFAWTNSDVTIGLEANGTGNIPAFTATNAGTAPVFATITVTPSANGCVGTPITFTITVNAQPAPIITPSINPVCFGNTGTYTTELGMTNYIWTIVGGSPTNGGGTTDNSVTVTWNGTSPYSVSVNYINGTGCSASTPSLLPVTITPLPTTSPIFHN